MNSQAIATALSGRSAAEYQLRVIYQRIVEAEEKYLRTLVDDEKTRFKAKADENSTTGRIWGVSWFEQAEIAEINVQENGVEITFTKEDYCRSCYMGTITDTIVIPNDLIDVYDLEDDYDGSVFDAAISKYIQGRITAIWAAIHQEEETLARKAEEKIVRDQAKRRKTYEVLKAEFEGGE